LNVKATVDDGALGVAGYSLGAGRAVRGAASKMARRGLSHALHTKTLYSLYAESCT